MIWLISTVIVLVLIISIYNATLACISIYLIIKKKAVTTTASDTKFIIVIPAHNEESELPSSIESCQSLDYSKDLYDILVVADNCTDKTSDIAKSYGVDCLIRSDQSNIGKGHALSYAFDHISNKEYDAVVILDADCIISSDSLSIFSSKLNSGQKVLQANYIVSNINDSPTSYMFGVGNYIENELYWFPKSKTGLSVFLRGTGMVLDKEILEAFPWCAHSIVEDVEYSLKLLENDIDINFVREASIESKFPTTYEQLKIQRERWAKGNADFGISNFKNIIFLFLKKRKFIFIDILLTFLTLSKPLLILLLLSLTFLTAIYNVFNDNSTITFTVNSIVISLLLLNSFYYILAILLLGISKHRISLLGMTFTSLTRLIIVNARSLIANKKSKWERTPRK